MIKNVRRSEFLLASGVLRRSQWFARFNAEMLGNFVDTGELKLLSRGQALCRSGDKVASLCVVVEGTLDVCKTSSAGKRLIVTCLEQGQIMNLIPIMDDQLAIHDAFAHDETTVLLIPKQIFLNTIDRDQGLSRSMTQLLCRRSRQLYENISDNALLTLRARCARLLLTLMRSYGLARIKGVAISLKLSQEDFADMLGRTRQSVNRELKQFERDGIIEMTYSHFIIIDEQALKAVITD
jgi:CRP-like cAMP-binding protein